MSHATAQEIALGEALAFTSSAFDRETTKLEGFGAPPSSVLVSYDCLQGNQPNAYGNTLVLWQNTQVAWDQDPEATVTIGNNNKTGSQAFDDLELQAKPYIVGYTTGKEPSTVCSTIYFAAGFQGPGEVFESSISILHRGTDSIVVGFNTPQGNDPQQNQNWIGLYEGGTFTWDGRNRVAKVKVTKSTAVGSQVVSHKLALGRNYTLVYATGPLDTNVACKFTFTA